MAHNITILTSPSGYGSVTGAGSYEQGTSVTLTATPNTRKRFVAWHLVNDLTLPFELPAVLGETTTLQSRSLSYTFTMGNIDRHFIAEFRNAVECDVKCETSPSGIGSVYQSAKKVYEGESVTLRAREEKGYTFSHWSNGAVTNPITISVEANLEITAYYTKDLEDNTYHQYRAFIKDTLSLNTLPKAFVVVRSFDICRDLLTNAKSSFKVIEIPSNVNQGDVFVLYNPQGVVMYYGVISSLDEEVIKCTQIQSFYAGNWVYDTYPTTSLEAEISYLLTRFASGYQKGSSYQDTLINQEKAPIKIKTSGTTSTSLETKDDKTIMDFEKFIYSLYDSYGIVFDFYIPFGTWTIGSSTGGSVTIRKPTSSTIKIGTNAECVQDMTPTTQVAEINKLIIYARDGTYRTTYVSTTTSGIVTEPSSIVGRVSAVNTKIIFSDDDLTTLKKANITDDMYNHKVEFTLLLDNNIYDFWSWELGQPIQIYDNGSYFDSVFTGYELTKEENQNPIEVRVVCGKVRTKLTSLLSLGVAS